MVRQKRSTAGRRMSTLIGQAQEDDDAFWGHSTWAEDNSDDDSGNHSFHESDQDSVERQDVFDSDFNDSESDSSDEEERGKAERELQRQERASKQRQTAQKNSAYAGAARSLFPKKGKKGKRGAPGSTGGRRRVVGDGINAGLVLNFPPASPLPPTTGSYHPVVGGATTLSQQGSVSLPAAPISAAPLPPATITTSATIVAAAATSLSTAVPTSIGSTSLKAPPSPSKTAARNAKSIPGATRERRSQQRKLRDHRSTPDNRNKRKAPSSPSTKKTHHAGAASTANKKTTHKRSYGQEELLLEAIHETEPANQRWILARKRYQDTADQLEKNDLRGDGKYSGKHGKVLEKFHSRRGCFITLTFPEMDAVPEILTRQAASHAVGGSNHTGSNHPAEPQRKDNRCVISNQPGRYRDPKTKLPYHDSIAFKELRRRYDAGEKLDQRPKARRAPTTVANAATRKAVSTAATAAPGKPKVIASKTTATDKKKTAAPASRVTSVSITPLGMARLGSPTQKSSPHKKDPTTPSSASSRAVVGSVLSTASPPDSGERRSRRKWKPSERALQHIQSSPKPVAGLNLQPAQQVVSPVPPLPAMVADPHDKAGSVANGNGARNAELLPQKAESEKVLPPLDTNGGHQKQQQPATTNTTAQNDLILQAIQTYATTQPDGHEERGQNRGSNNTAPGTVPIPLTNSKSAT